MLIGETQFYKTATETLEKYLKGSAKAKTFLDNLSTDSDNYTRERAFCQFIFLTSIRNKSLIDAILCSLITKRPKPKLYAILLASCSELIEDKRDKSAKIINSWVEFTKRECSLAESRMTNAVLRKFFKIFSENISKIATFEDFVKFYAIPEWLASRWKIQHGEESALNFIKNIRKEVGTFFRIQETHESKDFFKNFSESFLETPYKNFYEMKSGCWEKVKTLLNTPYAYIQDPSTVAGLNRLDFKDKKNIIDLCASPGGKSRFICDKLYPFQNAKEKSLLVAVDLEKRMDKLKENLGKVNSVRCEIVACDLIEENLEKKLKERCLPTRYDIVCLDAPCSNTGVLRRRPDVLLRLQEDDIARCINLQKELLVLASKFVENGGTLLYSTCSIDREENMGIAEYFKELHPNFDMEISEILINNDTDSFGISIFKKKS